jgi:hypothetical protein
MSDDRSINSVPSLDSLVREPQAAHGLPRATLAALLAKTAVVQSVLTAELAAQIENVGVGCAEVAPENWLDDEGIAAMLHVEHAWLVRHRNRLPFAKRLSRKRWLYSESGARRWLASRRSS